MVIHVTLPPNLCWLSHMPTLKSFACGSLAGAEREEAPWRWQRWLELNVWGGESEWQRQLGVGKTATIILLEC